MTTLALIPARSGSKGVPNKNLRTVGGVSLLERAIQSACVPDVDDILVSTDSREIQGETIRCGGTVPFLRPAKYAADNSSTRDCIMSAVSDYQSWSGKSVDMVVLLEPTSPFRTNTHVNEALQRMLTGKFRSVVSVCPVERKPENIFIKNEFLVPYINDPKRSHSRRQDMDYICRVNSAIYVFHWPDFVDTGTIMQSPIGWTEMTQEESINIDSELDLMLCEAMVSRLSI